ncbi:MAG: hypothetical protein R3Y46_07295 [Opitutales bacterium]
MKNIIFYRIVFLILGIVASIFALGIYYGYRPNSLLFFSFTDFLGLNENINEFRLYSQNFTLSESLVNNLPYSLMVFSYMMFILSIWGNERKIFIYIYFYFASFISIFLEILQFFKVLRGTFDVLDIIFIAISTILASLFLIPLRSEKKVLF